MDNYFKEELDNFINYAVRKGYLDPDEVRSWTYKEKYSYLKMAEILENSKLD